MAPNHAQSANAEEEELAVTVEACQGGRWVSTMFEFHLANLSIVFSSPEGELLQSQTTVVRCLLAAHVSQPLARFQPNSSMLYVQAISPDVFFIFVI
jgi:hypothetical protein